MSMSLKLQVQLMIVMLIAASALADIVQMAMPHKLEKTIQQSPVMPARVGPMIPLTSRSRAPRMKSWSLPRGSQIKYFEVNVDHFGFAVNKTFKIKYIINQVSWKSGGPIFFYTGNEGSIELFANNTGFVWEIAPSYKAMVVFAEHRYYGVSMPFGKDSFKNPANFGYLTAEQALADYAELLVYLKSSIKGAASSPVIAFGGSYGGMLAAWMRQKYPNIIAGSIAASAPVLMFTGEEKLGCNGFNLVLTHSYTLMGGADCSSRIRSAWDMILKTDPRLLTKVFRLCAPLKSPQALVNWLNNAIVDIGMANYPYPTDFLAHLPAWPVKVFCTGVKRGKTALEGMVFASQVYYNSSGKAKCLNLSQSQAPTLDADGWGYQSCMEMVMPICANGKTDMFLPQPWNLAQVMSSCAAYYKVTPRPLWIPLQFWGRRVVNSASNIVFSNGALDPWAAGGVKQTPDAKRLPVIVIKEGAHHLDLRASNPLDPPSVKEARKTERSWISAWIKAWK